MAAQDAELKLKVSLDLGFFRQQLAGLGQAAAGYNIPVNIKFDRSVIANELRNLERALGKKKINIELNLLGGLTKDQLERIQGRLEALSKTKKVEIPVSVKNGATGRDIQETIVGIRQRIAANQQIRQGDGKLRIPTSIKPSITNADVSEFKKAVQQKLSGISVKVKAEVERGFSAGPTGAAGLFEYMRSQGLSGGNVPQATEVGRSERLKKALEDLTVKQLQALAKEQGVGGVSRLKKDPLIDKLVAELNQDIAENILGNIKNQLRDVGKSPLKGVLDTFARGLFNMLGMDPAAMRQQMAERRALPSVSFPSTIPPRNISIGPSETGRALPPGTIPSALPGTAFGAQKYLPTGLSDEMQRIMRSAAYAFVDSIKQQIRSVRIGLAASQQPLLSPSRIAGLLPAGVGRAPSVYSTGAVGGETRAEMMARREREARMRSDLRGMDVIGGGEGRTPSPYSYAYRGARPTSAIVPYAAGGAIVPQPAMVQGGAGGGMQPPSGGGGRFGGLGGAGAFGRAMAGVNLPGAGTIRELGSEFAFATKQVLLFGQAYKLLGFFQDLPGQVSDAVSKLQSFRNTLEAITPSAQEAKASNEAILDLVEKYNVPLQSARDGFTKLYASMEPAGFNGDQIRGLFTGITKAAATFGMSADKVDRVNYAFAQMASKGQVMSEELKGQLGDVLPGAMAIFAQAAGFKGPKAIADFSAALEEGRYKGEAMVALLNNVSIVMNAKFAAGAQGAASTFQGAMNNMQTSLQLFYQSFEPLAVQFLNGFVTPIANGLKTVTDGLNAFFTGATAETSGGFAIARELESLKTSFNGIKETIFDLLYQFKLLAQGALQLAKVLLQIASNPIIGFFIQLYAQALLVTTVLRALIALPLVQAFVSFGRQIIALSASMNSLSSTTVSTRIQLGLLASGANGTGIAFSGAARQATVFGVALRAALGATVIGAIVIGLGLLIQKFVEMGQRLDDVKAKAQGAAQAIRSMSRTEARTEEQKRQSGVRLLERLSTRQGVNYRKTGTSAATNMVPINEQEAAQLEALGVPVQRSPIPGMKGGMISRQSIAGSIQQQQDLMREAQYTQTRVKFDEQQAEQQLKNLAPIPEGGGDGKTKKGGKTSLKEILDIENQLGARMKASDREVRLQELIRNAKLAGNEGEAESLENLSKALDIQGKISTLQKYRDELIEKESQIVGKNLTQKEYDNKLQEANVKLHELSNELKIAFYDLQVKEAGAAKKAQDDLNKKIEKQKELNRLIEDAQIEAGIISPQDAAVRLQRRGFEDAQAKIKAEGTPEQLTQLTAAQALIPEAGSLQETMKTLREELDKLLSTQEMVKSSAASIGEAFSTSFKNAITGASSAQEALAGFFQSVGNAFADMAAQMIQKMIQIYILDQFLKILPGAGGMFTGDASIQGGGFGSFSGGDFSAGGVPDLPGLGGAGALAGGGGIPSYAGIKFANGGIALGGFKAFANGGMVTGPTLGLVGEGRYNEAVVPLPDGKTIPVDLGNAAGNQIVSNITVNVNNGQAQSNASGSNSSDLGRKLEGAVKQVIVGELRPGGLLAR